MVVVFVRSVSIKNNLNIFTETDSNDKVCFIVQVILYLRICVLGIDDTILVFNYRYIYYRAQIIQTIDDDSSFIEDICKVKVVMVFIYVDLVVGMSKVIVIFNVFYFVSIIDDNDVENISKKITSILWRQLIILHVSYTYLL